MNGSSSSSSSPHVRMQYSQPQGQEADNSNLGQVEEEEKENSLNAALHPVDVGDVKKDHSLTVADHSLTLTEYSYMGSARKTSSISEEGFRIISDYMQKVLSDKPPEFWENLHEVRLVIDHEPSGPVFKIIGVREEQDDKERELPHVELEADIADDASATIIRSIRDPQGNLTINYREPSKVQTRYVPTSGPEEYHYADKIVYHYKKKSPDIEEYKKVVYKKDGITECHYRIEEDSDDKNKKYKIVIYPEGVKENIKQEIYYEGRTDGVLKEIHFYDKEFVEVHYKDRVEQQFIVTKSKEINDLFNKTLIQSDPLNDEFGQITDDSGKIIHRLDPKARKLALERREIHHPFVSKQGQCFGGEKVTRIDMVSTAYASVEQALAYWDTRSDSDEKQRMIKYYKAMQANILANKNADGKDWFDCNYWRYLIRDCLDYNVAADAYVSAPINMRYQEYFPQYNLATDQCEGESIGGFMRLGVIADLRNTAFTLAEMRALAKCRDEDEREELTFQLVERLYKMGKKKDPENNVWGAIKSILTSDEKMTQKQLALIIKLINNEIAAMKDEIDSGIAKDSTYLKCWRFQSLARALKQIDSMLPKDLPDGEIASAHSKRLDIVQEKESAMSDQMLHLVAAQIAMAPQKALQKEFRMANVGLLNGQVIKIDDTGWIANEVGEISDMALVFQEFNGRTIFYGEREVPPYLDGNGNLHVPAPSGVEPGTSSTLKTIFFNITPQPTGISLKKGPYPIFQQEINGANLLKLNKIKKQLIDDLKKKFAERFKVIQEFFNDRESSKDREIDEQTFNDLNQINQKALTMEMGRIESIFQKIEKIFANPKTKDWGSFAKTEELGFLLHQLGFCVSVNCASGKDRTGATSEGVVNQFLGQEYGPKVAKQFGSERIAGASAQVAFENTGKEHLKVTPLQQQSLFSALFKFGKATSAVKAEAQWKKSQKDVLKNQRAALIKQKHGFRKLTLESPEEEQEEVPPIPLKRHYAVLGHMRQMVTTQVEPMAPPPSEPSVEA